MKKGEIIRWSDYYLTKDPDFNEIMEVIETGNTFCRVKVLAPPDRTNDNTSEWAIDSKHTKKLL